MDVDNLFGVFDEAAPASAATVESSSGGATAKRNAAQAKLPENTIEEEIEAQRSTGEAVAGSDLLAVADEQKAKRAKKKAAKQAAKAAEEGVGAPGDETITAEAHVISGGSKECTHEVAVPAGYNYIPLHETPFPEPEAMAKTYPFTLDPFQRESVRCIERKESVLVSAHTSAGKTVVAEYAIALSLKAGQRVIYTSPIKALSNQKYRELAEEFQDVGLMTGDTTINPSASCLVMTTEILRSMLYRGSEIMREVGWVVFDEIHYMRDLERGVVWEEAIILLPDNVHYVFLSATIPNALQFAQWICNVHKQPCHVVYTDYRPTPLRHFVFPAGGSGMYLCVDEKGVFREDTFLKAMMSLASGGAANKNKHKGGKGAPQASSEMTQLVKTCMERQLHPCIVFSFSKRDCESYAMKLSKLDFNTDEEKAAVQLVFHNAIEALSEEDRKLPQVRTILPLLQRGIGIHHGGLLPIIKEVIEILFGEGLVKILFATETFAMGLNMPARTVLFSNVSKFDGTKRRFLTSGEYIQMSGRAGRRGLDDKGTVIVMLEEKLEPHIAKQMLRGQADHLNSAFHLTYNMVLNLLRVEDINPEYMLERSFFQFQNTQAIPKLEAMLATKRKEHATMNIPREEVAMAYYSLLRQRRECRLQLQEAVMVAKYVVPFLKAGRLVSVVEPNQSWGWGMVVNFQERKGQRRNEPSYYIVDVLLRCATGSESKGVPSPAVGKDRGEILVIPVRLNLLSDLSKVCIYAPDNLKPEDKRRSTWKAIEETLDRFNGSPPPLHPVKDLGITDETVSELLKQVETVETRMAAHELHEDPDRDELVAKCRTKDDLSEEVASLKRQLKVSKSVQQLDELKNRKRVLRRLQFCTVDDVVEIKGRVACEISTGDELLLTEMIFAGIFNDIDSHQAVAILSCFVAGPTKDTTQKKKIKMEEDLAEPLRQMHEAARRIARVSVEAKLPVTEKDYVNNFSTHLMDVVYAWSQGARFVDICELTDEFEGSIIRAMRRLEELLKQMVAAAKAIGNSELELKFAEAITFIRRDIIFAASLYL